MLIAELQSKADKTLLIGSLKVVLGVGEPGCRLLQPGSNPWQKALLPQWGRFRLGGLQAKLCEGVTPTPGARQEVGQFAAARHLQRSGHLFQHRVLVLVLCQALEKEGQAGLFLAQGQTGFQAFFEGRIQLADGSQGGARDGEDILNCQACQSAQS